MYLKTHTGAQVMANKGCCCVFGADVRNANEADYQARRHEWWDAFWRGRIHSVHCCNGSWDTALDAAVHFHIEMKQVGVWALKGAITLSWPCERDKIACFLYISLPEHLCGSLTRAKWTEPMPIRDPPLFNIALARTRRAQASHLLSETWALNSFHSGNDLLLFQRRVFMIHTWLIEIIHHQLINYQHNWLNFISGSL